MEEKELQQMFEAKRTTEANRRRQEELRRLIKAEAQPKSRRLWPVWAGAAAASVALLIATLPLLITNNQPASLPIAQADVPEVPEAEVAGQPLTTVPDHRPTSAPSMRRHKASTAEEPIIALAANEEDAVPPLETEEVPLAEAPAPALADNSTPQSQSSTAPRIHRRTSTRMVSGNSSESPVKEAITIGEALAQVLSSGASTPLTLKKIELS